MVLRDLFGVCLLFSFLLVAGNLAGDPGVGWHLQAGKWIAIHRSAPLTDPFLSPPRAVPWIHDQWLSDLALWGLYAAGGMALAQAVLIGAAAFAYVALLGASVARPGITEAAVFLSLAILSPLASLQWFVRPVVFSFVLFIVVYRAARAWSNGAPVTVSDAIVLASIFLLWANLHPGFPIGFALLGAAAGQLLIQHRFRQASLVAGASALAGAATFLNPYGTALHRSIGALLGNPYFMQLNSEWRSPDFSDPVFTPFLVVLLVFFTAALRGRRSGSHFDLLLLILFAFLGLSQRRAIPYFAVVTAVPLAELIEQTLARPRGALRLLARLRCGRSRVLLPLTSAAWIGFTAFLVWNREPFGTFPPTPSLSAARAVQSEKDARVFHSPDLGGLLTWFGDDGPHPSIDDRNQLCTVGDYEKFFTAALARRGWREALDGFDLAIVADTDPLRHVIRGDGWSEAGEHRPLLIYRRP